MIAKVWAQRLKSFVVIAANEDFIPGKVSFSVRSATDTNLTDFMVKLREEGGEIGYGHEGATGGIVDKPRFTRLLRALGFTEGLLESA